MRVEEAMRAEPVVVDPSMTVADARRVAEDAGVRHLVVADGRRVLGIVEEDGLWLAAEDVLRTAAGLQGSLTARDSRTVRAAMRAAEPSVSPNESLATAARVMLLKQRTAVPVIDGGRLVGILTIDECRKAVGAPLVALPSPVDDDGGTAAPSGHEDVDEDAQSTDVA